MSLLVIPSRSDAMPMDNGSMSGERIFHPFSDMKIRTIKLTKVAPIGPGINDTIYHEPTPLEDFINSTHFTTRDKTILNNLLIKPGDIVDPVVLADNERLLRRLPYIADARIVPLQVAPDEVDLLIITKDQYSLGFGFDAGGLKAGKLDLYELNFLGIGHRIMANVYYDFNESRPMWGYGLSYTTENILGTFIQAGLQYRDAYDTKSAGIYFDRPFVTPDIKYSYGARNHVIHTAEDFDTALSRYPLRYYYQDYYLSRSFKLSDRRNRLIFSGRFVNNHVFERPNIGENEYHHLQQYQLYLASAAYSTENFYKLHMIYNFGRTEDIPHGTLWELTAGWENNEFSDRYYAGLEASFGDVIPRFGYLFFKMGAGGFFNQQKFNRGIFQIKTNYFSPLISMNRSKFRQFMYLDYTNGIQRYADETINIGDGDLIRGLRSDSLSGTQRFNVKLESVVFSPYYLAGFRFVFYGFADLGFISESDEPIFAREMYSGIGMGVRIRNENLSFRTIQIRFAWYPILPPDVRASFFDISGESYYRPESFTFDKPDILEFK
jgi:outer membrane protein assembly factor BamA